MIHITEGSKSVWRNPNFVASKLSVTSKGLRFHLRSSSYLGLIIRSIISFFKWRRAKWYFAHVNKHTWRGETDVLAFMCHVDMSQRKQDLTQITMELQFINILFEILERLCIYLFPTCRRTCLIIVIFILILNFCTVRNIFRFQMSYSSNGAITGPALLARRSLELTWSLLWFWWCSSLGRPAGGGNKFTTACLGAGCSLSQVLHPDMCFCCAFLRL